MSKYWFINADDPDLPWSRRILATKITWQGWVLIGILIILGLTNILWNNIFLSSAYFLYLIFYFMMLWKKTKPRSPQRITPYFQKSPARDQDL